jgi:hypothetical protein
MMYRVHETVGGQWWVTDTHWKAVASFNERKDAEEYIAWKNQRSLSWLEESLAAASPTPLVDEPVIVGD